MNTSENRFIDKIDRLIDANLDDPAFMIDTICQAMGVSRSQLHRLLKEQTNLSASRYTRYRRLLQARHLLSTTDLRVSEICDQVGFNNPENFTTYFTDEFQLNPSDFRRQSTNPTSEESKAILRHEPITETDHRSRPAELPGPGRFLT
jgi:AraC-like DNA-binding protein